MDSVNGQRRLVFDPGRPNASLDLDTSEAVLQLLCQADRARLGAYIAEALTGVKPRGDRRRRGQEGEGT